jgi:acetyl esterase
MPITAEVQEILKLRAAAPAMHTLSVEEARISSAAARIQPDPPEPVARIEDFTIPGPAGDIPVRLYSPDPDTQLPVLVYYHGGGWVIGDLDSHDPLCRTLANRANVVVLSVHYRLAPEHKYPAAADDSYAAAQWVSEHGAEIGADGSRIVVCGDSAGGNLSAVVSLMARDRGGPGLRGQVLIYPVTNLDFGTDSYRDNGDGSKGLSEDGMRWFWQHYVRTQSEGFEPYASPLRADTIADLPPALVITAEYDALRDEGELYADRLERGGVTTQLTRYDGVIHGFVGMFAAVPEGNTAVNQIAEFLKETLA